MAPFAFERTWIELVLLRIVAALPVVRAGMTRFALARPALRSALAENVVSGPFGALVEPVAGTGWFAAVAGVAIDAEAMVGVSVALLRKTAAPVAAVVVGVALVAPVGVAVGDAIVGVAAVVDAVGVAALVEAVAAGREAAAVGVIGVAAMVGVTLLAELPITGAEVDGACAVSGAAKKSSASVSPGASTGVGCELIEEFTVGCGLA
jgi:hypothetical protein